jgi:hypothetical protein
VENEGKLAIIHMALYGESPLEETSGITWDLDPALLIQMSGWDLPSRVMEQRYMKYVLIYTNGALSIGVEARSILRKESGQSLMSHMIWGVVGFMWAESSPS